VSSDEAPILAVLDALDEALDRRDPGAVTALFVDDPAVTFWGATSEEAIGPESIRTILGPLLDGTPGTFTLAYHDRRVTIHGDLAWVNASGDATWERPGRDTMRMPYRLTAIFVRDGDACALAHAPRVVAR
jgi:ketosteroid isomerase-like protein